MRQGFIRVKAQSLEQYSYNDQSTEFFRANTRHVQIITEDSCSII